jgi:hypothetical protein
MRVRGFEDQNMIRHEFMKRLNGDSNIPTEIFHSLPPKALIREIHGTN